MKTKVLAGILAIGVLLAAGPVGAVTFYTDTVANWFLTGGVLDADTPADTMWTMGVTTLTAAQQAEVTVTMIETELGGVDTYTINFNFQGLTPNNFLTNDTRTLSYSAVVVGGPEFFLSVRLDADGADVNSTGSYGADKTVTYASGVNNLSSTNGVPDGPQAFTGQPTSLAVDETFRANAAGQLFSTTDTYNVGVQQQAPEPATLLLLGAALAGLGFSRRRKSS